jgi:ATP-dependent DNA helicase PIF1
MLIKNVDEILVNGLVGSVIGFYNPDELAVGTPLSSSTSSVASSSSSVASSSKVTTKAVNNRILRYVQLSEDGRTPTVIPVAKKDQKGKNAVQEEQYPLVLFEYPLRDEEGYGSEAVLFEPEEFKVDDAEGKTLARRVQL